MSQESYNGRRIGPYEIESLLGQGPAAQVHRARQMSNAGRLVAIKLYPSIFNAEPDFKARFIGELQAVARLQHPAILPIFDLGVSSGQPFVAMHFAERGSLADRLLRFLRLSADETLRFIQPIASALDLAHGQGLVHHNLKPSNILFSEGDSAYLSDFTLHCVREAQARLTGAGYLGSPAYSAPEIGSGGQVGPAADVYALGVLAFQALTGRLPFEAATAIQQIMLHVTEAAPSPRAFAPDLSLEIEQAILRALAKRPEDRPESAGAIAHMLAIAGQPDDHPTLSGPALQALAPGGLPPSEVPMSQASPAPKASSSATRDRGSRRRSSRRSGPPWYTVVLIVALLLVAWMGVGMLVGEEFRAQAARATEAIQAVAAASATQAASAAAEAQRATDQAATATAQNTQVAVQPATIAATDAPLPTATALAASGGLIAYQYNDGTDQEVHLLDLRTGEITVVTNNSRFDGGPAFSPDGREIAYFSEETSAGTHIFSFVLASGERREITSGISADSWPVWSPDGSRIAYFYDDGSRSWVYTVASSGGAGAEFAQVPRSEVRPLWWSADGLMITFLGQGPEGALELLRTSQGGLDREPLTQLRGAVEFADLSPDGQTFVFSVLLADAGVRQVYLADATCAERVALLNCNTRPITRDGFQYFAPRFSPDGRYLLVASNRTGNSDLFLMDLDGNVLQQLTNTLAEETNAVWQPAVR